MVWYSQLFKNFPEFIVIHTVKGFRIVNKADADVLLDLSCFFNDPANVDNLTSGSFFFSILFFFSFIFISWRLITSQYCSGFCHKSNLNIWNFMVHVMLKPGLETFKHYFTGV